MSSGLTLPADREEILAVAAKYGARNVRVFGSFARGETSPSSDLDLLVNMDKEHSLLDTVQLIDELRALTGRNVDVVTEQSLYWLLKDRVLAEAVPL